MRRPGGEGPGWAMYSPLTDNWGELIMVAGHPPAKLNEESGASWDRVSANYLQNWGMPILRGRAFSAADNETTAPVAIVNEAFVKRFFKSEEDPLAQHFGLAMPEYASTFSSLGGWWWVRLDCMASRRIALRREPTKSAFAWRLALTARK